MRRLKLARVVNVKYKKKKKKKNLINKTDIFQLPSAVSFA
jgi:hypothetical protein